MSIATIASIIDDFEVFIILAILISIVILRKKIVKYIRVELDVKGLKREILKNRILVNIHCAPYKAEIIETDYKEYKEIYEGNSYIDGLIVEWRSAFEKELLQKRIGVNQND
jgi:hypothetical protein